MHAEKQETRKVFFLTFLLVFEFAKKKKKKKTLVALLFLKTQENMHGGFCIKRSF
jgi:hypothetical protein